MRLKSSKPDEYVSKELEWTAAEKSEDTALS